MGTTFQFAWEVELIKWCQEYIPSFIIEVLNIISYVGDTLILVSILAFIYLCYDKRIGRKAMANILMSFMIAGEIKNIFKRRRPYFDNVDIECLKPVEKDYDIYDINKQGFSFPSMHSSNVLTIMGTTYVSLKKNILLVLTIIFSLIVGISRFVLGCHYPTDVLVGWTLGTLTVIFGSKLFDKLSDIQLYMVELAIGFIGCLFCTSHDFYSMLGITIGFIFTDILEKKYTNFKNTRNPIKVIARLLLSGALFLLVYESSKLLLPSEIVELNIVTVIRYAVSSFLALGIAPMIYKYNILKLDDKTKEDM